MLLSKIVTSRIACVLIIILLFQACQQEASTESEETELPAIRLYELEIVREALLKSEPNIEATTIRILKEGEQLEDLGKVGNYTSPLIVEGVRQLEPWVKVKTQAGEEGWILSSPFYVFHLQHADVFFQEKRFEAFFGTAEYLLMKEVNSKKDTLTSPGAFANYYYQMLSLRSRLANKINAYLRRDPLLEWNYFVWLNQFLPELVLQQNGDRSIELYLNYKDLGKLVENTTAQKTVNNWLDVYYMSFPIDSIEYQFPAWLIEVGKDSTHNLLGRGIHEAILNKLSTIIEIDTSGSKALLAIKDRMIAEWADPETSYWESKNAVVTELEKIMDRNFVFLTKADNIALQVILDQLKSTSEKEMIFNYKTGINDLTE